MRHKAKFSVVGVFIVLMALIVACGEEATPTTAPPQLAGPPQVIDVALMSNRDTVPHRQ